MFEEGRDDVLASWDLGIEEICSDVSDVLLLYWPERMYYCGALLIIILCII